MKSTPPYLTVSTCGSIIIQYMRTKMAPLLRYTDHSNVVKLFKRLQVPKQLKRNCEYRLYPVADENTIMNISIRVFKSLNLRHLRFLRQIFPSSKNISWGVQIVTFANVSLFQTLMRLRLNIASSLFYQLCICE